MRLVRAILAVLCVAAACAAQAPSLEIAGFVPPEGKFPVEGQATAVTLNGAALVRVDVTYRPNSKVTKKVTLQPGGDGAVSWSPEAPGLAQVEAFYESGGKEASVKRTVSVAFASALTSGVLVMLLAGSILFGGAFLSIRALLRGQSGPDA